MKFASMLLGLSMVFVTHAAVAAPVQGMKEFGQLGDLFKNQSRLTMPAEGVKHSANELTVTLSDHLVETYDRAGSVLRGSIEQSLNQTFPDAPIDLFAALFFTDGVDSRFESGFNHPYVLAQLRALLKSSDDALLFDALTTALPGQWTRYAIVDTNSEVNGMIVYSFKPAWLDRMMIIVVGFVQT